MTRHQENLSDSAYDFQRVVWPHISPWLGGGDLEPVESQTPGPFGIYLDIYAGIDFWRIDHNERGVQGIASRVQYVGPYTSFTVRESLPSGGETELAKRLRALDDMDGRWVLPAFTVQAYLDERRVGDLQYVCMARTADLLRFIRQHHERLRRHENPVDGNEFLVVWVEDLIDQGIRVWEQPQNGLTSLELHREEMQQRPSSNDEVAKVCYRCGHPALASQSFCLGCGAFLP